MKRTDLKENSPIFFIGKSIIIAAILITSSLSFMLGYFVGKNAEPPVVSQKPLPPPQESVENKDAGTEKQGTVILQPDQIQEARQTVKANEPQETRQTPENKGTKQAAETKQTATTTARLQEKKLTKEAEETQKIAKIRKYAVQAGAFKDVSDADALKAKLDKKGYKSYVIPTETKRHKKLYKVMAGEFVKRKEAEVLAIKIKRSEGLQTFVTFRKEQEELR